MISLKKRNQGFTIVELLIVIVVIGILALIVVTTYSGIQQKARNAKRGSDMATLQTQLEAFKSQNGYYPSLTNLNDPTWRKTNMKSLDGDAIKDPSNATCVPANATPACVGSTKGTKNIYSYKVFQSDGTTACETDNTLCAQYELSAQYEGTYQGKTEVVKVSLD